VNVQQEGAVTGRREGETKPKAKRDYVADHARRTLRSLGLAADEAKNVVLAIQSNDSAAFQPPKLSAMSRGLPPGVNLHKVLGDSYAWFSSSQRLNLNPSYFGDLFNKHVKVA